MTVTVHWTQKETSIGMVTLVAVNERLCWVGLPTTSLDSAKSWIGKYLNNTEFIEEPNKNIFIKTYDELEEYLQQHRKNFTVLYMLLGTEFQKKVWQKLSRIPYGSTLTYGTFTKTFADIKTVRAVGTACGVNPLPIIIPCHRVVGGNGSLVGYIGGLELKKKLLHIESLQLFA